MASVERKFLIGLVAIFVLLTIAAFSLEGTNSGGDSVYHYLMAHFSWKHPYLFFDHWGKPLFTILSSPFAIWGMHYMKFFNVIQVCLAGLFTYFIAKKSIQISPLWILVLYFSAPEGMNVILSGLTEPLFACLFSAAILLYYNRKDIAATVIVSFLPLSRSEGLIIMVVITVYLLLRKRWTVLPWLITGQLVITLLGYAHYHNILWVFTEIPYATLKTVYWKGPLMHFVDHMPYVFGPVSSGLLAIGLGYFAYTLIQQCIKRNWNEINLDKLFLIYGTFLAFLVSHSLFFYLGIFGEMGLSRVFVAVIPVMVLIALDGVSYLNWMSTSYLKWNPKWVKNGGVVLAVSIVFFCYGNPHFGLEYDKNIVLNKDQKIIADQVVPFIKEHYPNDTIFYSNTLIPYFFDFDLFDRGVYAHFITSKKPSLYLHPHEVIIWDSWFSRIEEKVTKDTLNSLPFLKCDTTFSYIENGKDTFEYKIYSAR